MIAPRAIGFALSTSSGASFGQVSRAQLSVLPSNLASSSHTFARRQQQRAGLPAFVQFVAVASDTTASSSCSVAKALILTAAA